VVGLAELGPSSVDDDAAVRAVVEVALCHALPFDVDGVVTVGADHVATNYV